MEQKASRQVIRHWSKRPRPIAVSPMEGVPANINRHTGLPHENKREIARNTK